MKKTVLVQTYVEVEIDESKFTDEFMQMFKEVFYDFDDIWDHIKYLASIEARGLVFGDFVEGYGSLKEMGIKLRVDDFESYIED